jgi:hypothetical protein
VGNLSHEEVMCRNGLIELLIAGNVCAEPGQIVIVYEL